MSNNDVSLYQQTIQLIGQLYSFPELEDYLFPQGLDTLMRESEEAGLPPIPDPAAVLWHVFRLGAPLCLLFNHINPQKRLDVQNVSQLETYTNVCKKMIYHFLLAIKEEGIVKEDSQSFSISELYKNDMGGFVKVRQWSYCQVYLTIFLHAN
jgi:cell division control protein 24